MTFNQTRIKTYRVLIHLRQGYRADHPPALYPNARNPAHAITEAVAMLKRMGFNPNHFDLQVKGEVKQP